MRSLSQLFRSVDAAIMIVVSVLFILGFTVYTINKPVTPSFYIYDVSFKLSEDKRSIEFRVSVGRGMIEIKELFVNNFTVSSWSADKRIIREGEEARCVLEYRWIAGKDHIIKLVTTDDLFTELVTRAPEITLSLNLEIKDVNATLSSGFLKVKTTYNVESNGTDTLHILLFTYQSFETSNKYVHIFYDPKYMPQESIKRADTIIRYFSIYNVAINKVDYNALNEISKDMPKIVLILINPLKDGWGRRLENAIPAPLADSDEDGYIKDDSKYGRSILYDWMKDEGLILITMGSLQPYKKILYKDGVYTHAKDSYNTFDAHQVLTDAYGEESIIKGRFTIGAYSPVRISDALGLSYRDEPFGFDKDALEGYNLQYYSYGDYKLPYENGSLNLTLPIFIRVGEGGWLAMGDEEFWLDDESLSHDLFMIYTHAVWDSEWIPYGWYWDSGSAFHSHYGVIRAEGDLETELIPSQILNKNLIIRIVCIAQSKDLNRGIIIDRLVEYKLP